MYNTISSVYLAFICTVKSRMLVCVPSSRSIRLCVFSLPSTGFPSTPPTGPPSLPRHLNWLSRASDLLHKRPLPDAANLPRPFIPHSSHIIGLSLCLYLFFGVHSHTGMGLSDFHILSGLSKACVSLRWLGGGGGGEGVGEEGGGANGGDSEGDGRGAGMGEGVGGG